MRQWSYSRCPQCPNDHRQVYPDGPLDARVVVVGEGPGKWEDSTGVPFCGRAGQELDRTYLQLAGLDREDVFVSNCVQCRCERNGIDVKPSDVLTRACAENHLREELQYVQPSTVILCGATACSLAGIDVELEHGIPRRGNVLGYECTVVPMFHPAAGLHLTSLMIPLLEDWKRLGEWFRGEWKPPQVIGETPDYRFLEGLNVILPLILRGRKFGQEIAVDTESDEDKPWSIQFSLKEGEAWMISAADRHAVAEFTACSEGMTFILHNAPYDLAVLRALGCRPKKIRDTMQELYHLGNQPQGLKAAVYRIFGHRMHSYDETVTPYSKQALEGWLAEALGYVSTSMRTVKYEQLKTKIRETARPHPTEAVLRRIMGKLVDGSEYDPWQPPKYSKGEVTRRLLGQDWLPQIEAEIGRMPRQSIVHVPLDEAVQYGCSDADWTLRLAHWLEGERGRITREEWKVA